MGIHAHGWVGYLQVSWLFGNQTPLYQSNEGLWRPFSPRMRHLFEAFAQVSHTYGDEK